MGPAGTTLVIVKKDKLGKINRYLPSMTDYKNHIEAASMFNTPPVYAVYTSMLTLRWIKDQGGVKAMAERNKLKAVKLYEEIDNNPLFYTPTHTPDRSHMNVNFLLHDQKLEKDFLEMCKQAGCIGLEGHRSVGGFRASIYNAMDIDGVSTLVEVMQEFTRRNG
jgi:phosphoserine aminotransferase